MLILIPGATGRMGLCLVRAALRRGHRAATPPRCPPDIAAELEGFVEVPDLFGGNVGAPFDRACAGGVDAVVVAWNEEPRLVLDAQLALLRAAERAGVRRFHAASWNTDWEGMPLGVIESYDAMICFARLALLSSPVKPLYVFCGVLAMTLFGVPGAGSLEGDSHLWVREEKEGGEGKGRRVINVVGAGATPTPFSTEDDAAEFSIALTTSEGAEKGGYFRFCSDEFSLLELKATYERVRGEECSINHVMDVETCKGMIKKAREEAIEAGELYKRFKGIVGLVYAVFLDEGAYNIRAVDSDRFPGVPRTKLEDYIRANEWI
ncbi:NAD(P)-binding protein [Apiospora hydei]|uniref:NAD(P)-binding protein n=1 Tax=Apiospora hydei TaxID=1337664 RepID=A0ABR1W7F6_9PEZI